MIKIICGEGWDASRRKDLNTLSNSLTNAMYHYKNKRHIFCEIDSRKRRSIKQIMKEITCMPDDTVFAIFLKSYGNVRFEKAIEKHYTLLRPYKKIRVCMVDIHGRAWFNRTPRPYGKRQDMIIDDEVFENCNIEFDCIYQRYKWPHGAKLKLKKGSKYNKRVRNHRAIDKNINHINIVNHRETIKLIHTVMEDIHK